MMPAASKASRRGAAYKHFAQQNLGGGRIHSARSSRKSGVPVKRSFMGVKRSKNAELSQHSLAIIEELKAEVLP